MIYALLVIFCFLKAFHGIENPHRREIVPSLNNQERENEQEKKQVDTYTPQSLTVRPLKRDHFERKVENGRDLLPIIIFQVLSLLNFGGVTKQPKYILSKTQTSKS